MTDAGESGTPPAEGGAAARTARRRTGRRRSGRRMRVCPFCGSADVRSLRLIYEAGTSLGGASGVGVGTHGGLGLAAGRLGGQTLLAAGAAPPRSSSLMERLGGFLGTIVGLAAGITLGILAESVLLFLVILVGCTGLGMFLGRNSPWGRNEAAFDARERDRYERTRRCLSCGAEFLAEG
jgi:hypothetical protein